MRTIVCLSGTSRPGNYTSRALAVVENTLRDEGCEVEHIDGRQLSLAFPGLPATDDAKKMEAAVQSAAGVIIATPEYHGSFSAMTKLMIENLGFPSALRGKAVGLVGVAAGRIGAIKSIEQLRSVCAHTGALVTPFAVSVAGVQGAFDDEGPTNQAVADSLEGFARQFVGYLGDFICPKYVLESMSRDHGDSWATSM